MADFITGSDAVAGDGDSYTVDAAGNLLLNLLYGYRNGTTTVSGQTFGGVALTEVHDDSINIAGGGDPFANLNYKISPSLTSQAIAATFSSTPTVDSGTCFSFENVDTINPVYPTNGSDSATYTTAAGNLTYDAPDDSVVFYYKYHCTNSASTISDPTDFDFIDNVVILTSPAYRQISFYKRKVVTAVSGQTVNAATSGSASVGGGHGFVVFQPPAVLPGVNIATVGGDDSVQIGENNVVITGTGFEASQGTGDITISPTDDVADLLAVTISTVDSWADTSIQLDIPSDLSLLYGDVYFFITNDSAETNTDGQLVSLNPPTGNQYLTIREQNDLGLLENTTGIELDADQLEWQTLSSGGGTVFVGPSGTVYIYDYPGSVPASEEVYYRLGDDSDQTWSSDTLETIKIGSESIISQAVSSLQSIGNVTLTVGAESISVAGLEVSQSITEPSITQEATLSVDSASSLQSVSNIELTQANTLSVQEVDTEQSISVATLLESAILSVSSISNEMTISEPVLTQVNILTVGNIDNLQDISNVALSVAGAIGVNSLDSSQTLSSPNISQDGVISVDGIESAQIISNANLIQSHLLLVSGLAQTQDITNCELTTGNITISVNGLEILQSISNIDLIQANILSVDDLSTEQLLSAISLGGIATGYMNGELSIFSVYNGEIVVSSAVSGETKIFNSIDFN